MKEAANGIDQHVGGGAGLRPGTSANYATYPPDSEGAKCYTSAVAKAFFAQQTAQLEVFQLPTYSPNYNAIEKL